MTRHSFRIAMVAPCPFPFIQGSQVYIREMAEALCRRGHTVHLLSYHLSWGDEEPLPFKVHRIRDIPFYRKMRAGPHPFKPFLDLLLAERLMKVVREFDMDLVHAHNYEGPFVALPVRAVLKRPLIYNSHGLLSLELPAYRDLPTPLLAYTGMAVDHALITISDAVIAISKESADFYQGRGGAGKRVHYIPPGIDLERVDRTIERGVEPSLPYPTVVYAGNLDHYQNIGGLLRIFKEVVSRVPASRLIISSQSSFDQWKGHIFRSGLTRAVHYFNARSFRDMAGCIRSADVAVNPRLVKGGCPIKNLTYSALSKPVVAFETGGAGVRNGENGRIVKDGDEEGFRDALIHYLDGREKAIEDGRRGRELVALFNNWEVAIDGIEKVYEGLM